MANQEHIAKLKEGVLAWNEWRRQNSDVIPDFSGFDFSEPMQWHGTPVWNERKWFRHIDLQQIDLTRADIRKANLTFVNFTRAIFSEADLRDANLFKADLEEALLTGADIRRANLREAVIRECLCTGLIYTRAGLTDRCLGIRGAENCHGSPEFRRDVLDQDYIDALRKRWRANFAKRVFLLWPWEFFDYGRSWVRVMLLAIAFVVLFGLGYHLAEMSHDLYFTHANVGPTVHQWYYSWFVAAMGFATLGISDLVEPSNGIGAALMIGNVVSGFVTLGLLLSVLSNSFARRA